MTLRGERYDTHNRQGHHHKNYKKSPFHGLEANA